MMVIHRDAYEGDKGEESESWSMNDRAEVVRRSSRMDSMLTGLVEESGDSDEDDQHGHPRPGRRGFD